METLFELLNRNDINRSLAKHFPVRREWKLKEYIVGDKVVIRATCKALSRSEGMETEFQCCAIPMGDSILQSTFPFGGNGNAGS